MLRAPKYNRLQTNTYEYQIPVNKTGRKPKMKFLGNIINTIDIETYAVIKKTEQQNDN